MFKRVAVPAVGVLLVALLSQMPAFAQAVDIESALSAGRVYVKAMKVPHGARRTLTAGACWTTNDLSVPPYQGGWPVTREFFPTDTLAYATGYIRVTSTTPVTVHLHVENFATVQGQYKHLTRADMDADFEIYNDPFTEYTDWYLAVYRVLPGFLQIFPERVPVDWTNAISGFATYSCEGSMTAGPVPESGPASLK